VADKVNTVDEKTKAIQEKYGVTDGKNMHVKVYAPFKVYYDDLAESITAENDTGEFDILPKHHNFMTLINTCDVVVRNGEKEEKIPIQRGIMHVKSDEVIVFLDV
jgi:F0F1-type ATP synthase epsilon subunit